MQTGNVGQTPAQYNPITTTQTQNNQNAQNTAAAGGGASAGNSANEAIANPVDTFSPSMDVPRTRDLRGTADPQAIRNMIRETNHAGDAIRRLVRSLVGQTDASGQGFWAARADGVNFQLSEAERAEAQQMIGEDGFFGVQQTTDRIMDFARALVGSGASEEQIESMRAAVQEGFDQVAQMFGGFDNLPEVTRNTHAAIMEAFDNWVAGGQVSTTQTEQ
ncbi:MAG: hypothetical protein FWB97_08490 [Oscillospiraceae bacterium]|nr:hypothetical protein [Oscillospiraceae bacterium]